MTRISRWKPLIGITVLFGLITLFTLFQPTPEAVATEDITAFLERHWRLPIPPQGPPPSTYTPVEVSLHPKDCGVCHPQQYQDWQTSVHSRSMGPGVYGQLLNMDPATVTICANCHTPLSEQMPYQLRQGNYVTNKGFDADLQKAGLVCAACHVREHRRYGPPRRSDALPPPKGTKLPHAGFTASTAFQRAAFCKGCHQFNPSDFALNGKLLENTYEEWRQSPYAKEGTSCQSCHMPDRRHLWRGIHDPSMVRQAISVDVKPDAPSYAPGDRMQAVITISNTGAGHYLPTYVTPKIFVQAHLLDAQGKQIDGTAQQAIIGREITLDLSTEAYDTRIPPKGSRSFTYTQHVLASAVNLRVRIVVHPDHFYQRFFEAVLQDGGGGAGRADLEDALRATKSSSFTVFERLTALSERTGN